MIKDGELSFETRLKIEFLPPNNGSKKCLEKSTSLLNSDWDCIADLIKKLELLLTVVSVLLKIRFGHAQSIVPEIGIPMSKTACINPLHVYLYGTLSIKIEL